jgi:outer membrane protein
MEVRRPRSIITTLADTIGFMLRTLFCSLLFGTILCAEEYPMTLRQAVEMALKQNPDLALARLDEQKARHAVRVAHDPFVPRLIVGSGLAYSDGFPMSIEGAAPSVVQANASQYLFNRPQSYAIAQARENIRGARLGEQAKREEVAFRVASLHLDAERAARMGETAAKDTQSLQQVLAAVEAQVREGRALPLAEKQASLNLARARQTVENLQADQADSETALAVALGFSAQDRVRPVEEERALPELPATEEEAIQKALASNNEIRQLESQIAAKELEIRGERAARLPRVDLVAQYAMLARFNNYDEFFRKFQRNNGEIGVSVQLPVIPGPAINAQVAGTVTDIERVRAEIASTRNRIISDVEQSFREQKKADTAANVARLDLDVAREQASVILAQMEEGRATLRQAEEARTAENQKWIALYDAQYALEKARWNLLRLSGGLIASIEHP